MAEKDQLTAHSEVPAEPGGLPQMNVIADGSWTNQVFWLAVTFVALYIVVSRLVLPKVSRVIEDRDEEIRGNLDKAKADQAAADDSLEKVDALLADARTKAQGIIAAAKEEIQGDVAKATAKLDADLDARISAAEADVTASKAAAMADIEAVVTEVTTEIVSTLSGVTADEAGLKSAVGEAIATVRGDN